jgi:hypothetical protein
LIAFLTQSKIKFLLVVKDSLTGSLTVTEAKYRAQDGYNPQTGAERDREFESFGTFGHERSTQLIFNLLRAYVEN